MERKINLTGVDAVVRRDIEELERRIAANRQGQEDKERFRHFRLTRGVYGQRQVGVQMFRIKIPYGRLTARQLECNAEVSEKYTNGNLHLTTRQNIQLLSKANPLYPVFLKLHELRTLVVGAGKVGTEKLAFILKSSPEARLTIVAKEISEEARQMLVGKGKTVNLVQRSFRPSDIDGHDLIIAATNIPTLNREVHRAAKAAGRLVNVADSPALCDLYLGAMVTKGQLKIGISTNGQSPTLAKRFRQLLEDVLPDETHDLLNNLRRIRDRLGGDFAAKVRRLKDLTRELVKD